MEDTVFRLREFHSASKSKRSTARIKQCTKNLHSCTHDCLCLVYVWMYVSQRDQGLGSSLRNERLAETIFSLPLFSFLCCFVSFLPLPHLLLLLLLLLFFLFLKLDRRFSSLYAKFGNIVCNSKKIIYVYIFIFISRRGADTLVSLDM